MSALPCAQTERKARVTAALQVSSTITAALKSFKHNLTDTFRLLQTLLMGMRARVVCIDRLHGTMKVVSFEKATKERKYHHSLWS